MLSRVGIALLLLHLASVGAEHAWTVIKEPSQEWWRNRYNHTKCREAPQDNEKQDSEAALLRSLFTVLPPFVPVSSRVNNSRCMQHSQRFLRDLERLSLWALLMHDSSAKLPSGILNGNVNQYGDYDQCLQISSPDGDVAGQYCLAYVQADLTRLASSKVRLIHTLMRSFNVFKSEITDPGHRVPRFSSMNWGLCVPAACEAADIQAALEDTLQPYVADTGLALKVRVEQAMCQAPGWKPPLSFVLVSLVFLGIIVLAVLATTLDVRRDAQPSSHLSAAAQYVDAFSLRRNGRTLFNLKRSADDIESVHGIRFLNAYMLLLSHKSMAIFFDPYIDRTSMAVYVGELWTALARGASLYTDPFIMMSGLLTTYSFIRTLDRSGQLNVPREYVSRVMRLLPNLAALILFCTFILPWMGSGPQWNLVVRHHSEICKQYWWRNVLFIHNYFGFQNMCLTHTHHVGIDTQLFLVSPLLVGVLWRWPRAGVLTLLGIAAASTGLRYYITLTRNLTHFVFYGTSVSQLFDTADYSYILPTHRATVYIMGILLGYALLRMGRDFKIKESLTTVGWAVAAVLFYSSLLRPSLMGQQSYVYDPTDAANYSAFAPIAWCLCFVWIILLCYTGRGGAIGRFLSWRGFLVSTRLSYAIYLTQFPIFFYNVGSTRTTKTYTVLLLFNFFETAIIIVASIALTLLIDLPFQNIRNVMLKKKK